MFRMEMYLPSSCSRARWWADTMMFLGCSRRRITSSTVVFTVAAWGAPSGCPPLAAPDEAARAAAVSTPPQQQQHRRLDCGGLGRHFWLPGPGCARRCARCSHQHANPGSSTVVATIPPGPGCAPRCARCSRRHAAPEVAAALRSPGASAASPVPAWALQRPQARMLQPCSVQPWRQQVFGCCSTGGCGDQAPGSCCRWHAAQHGRQMAGRPQLCQHHCPLGPAGKQHSTPCRCPAPPSSSRWCGSGGRQAALELQTAPGLLQ